MAISKRRRFQVLERDGFRCRYCGTSGTANQLHVDHVMPVSRGGTDDMSNLVASCHACNLGKGALLLKSGIEANEEPSLVGLMCHGIDKGTVVYQGHIRRQVGKTSYLIQMYGWLFGEPIDPRIFDLADESLVWVFYTTPEEMRQAYYNRQGFSYEEAQWSEKIIGAL